MIVVAVHFRGGNCDALEFLWICLHDFFTEYGAIECYLGTLHLTFSDTEYKTIVTDYLH